jgi:hypothetical protein
MGLQLEPSIRSYEERFRCVLTMEYMRDPVQAADGFSYEYEAISRWFLTADNANTYLVKSPRTNKEMSKDLFRSFDFYRLYKRWCLMTGHDSPVEPETFGIISTSINNERMRESLHKNLIEAIEQNNIDAARLALENGADIIDDENEAIETAVVNQRIDIVNLLLDKGANVNANHGELLAIAVSREPENLELVNVLINRGANVRLNDDHAFTTACEYSYTDTMQLLLDSGVDIHAQGGNALRRACAEDNLITAKFLLERGVDPHGFNDNALLLVSMSGNLDMVRLLLQYDATVTDNALQEARNAGFTEIVKLLKRHRRNRA